jgi:hypothetical protein
MTTTANKSYAHTLQASPSNNSQSNASRKLPSLLTGVCYPHQSIHLNADHKDGAGSDRTHGGSDALLAECELTGLLVDYLCPKLGRKPDETRLLYLLQYVWNSREEEFECTLAPLTKCHREVLYTWIDERQNIARLRSIEGSWFNAQTSELKAEMIIIENDLKFLRAKWDALKKHNGLHELSLEDFLCGTLTAMTRPEKSKEEEDKKWFREALQQLRKASSVDSRADNSSIPKAPVAGQGVY